VGKFSDDIPLVPSGTVPPSFASALLRKLKVEDAPRLEQEAAVKEWLETNNPSPLLEHSLERKGFGVAK
jgi:hypothetical protein